MADQPKKHTLARDGNGELLPAGETARRDGGRWHPTDKQMAALEYCQERNYGHSVTDLAKNIDIHRGSYYEWFKNPAFAGWWTDQMEMHFALRLPKVYAALFESAEGGKDAPRSVTAACKIVLDRFDKKFMPQARHDVSITGELKLDLSEQKIRNICQQVIDRIAADSAGERGDAPGPS